MSKSSWSVASLVFVVVCTVIFCVTWLALATGAIVVHADRDEWEGTAIRVNVGEFGYGFVRTGGTMLWPISLVVCDAGAFGVERDDDGNWKVIGAAFRRKGNP